MNNLQLIKINNPFNKYDREVTSVAYLPGQTLLDIRNAQFPQDVSVIVSVNGSIIPSEELATLCPKHGDYIVFVPEVRGGGDGGGKAILGVIAMVALAIVAPYAAVAVGQVLSDIGLTALAGSAFFMTTVVPAAIMMVGGLLVGALMPTPKPHVPTMDKVDFDTSQTYSWSPQTTQQQGTVIPKFYGTNKLYGNIIAAYSESINDKIYINVLINLGIGPYKRLYGFQLNDQPIENFQGVEVHTRLGHVNQTPIPNFNDTKIDYPVSVKVVNGAPYTYATIGNNFNGLEVDITFPQGLYYANDKGGLDSYSVNFKVEIRKQGTTSWRAITSQVITTQYTVYSGKWSAGAWLWDEYQGQYWWEYQAGTTDKYAHYNGEEVYIGDPYYTYAYWRWIETSTVKTASSTVDYMTVSGAKSSLIKRTVRVDNLDAGAYEVRITNLSADQTSTRYGDDMYLTSVREILYDDFEYPRHVLVGIKALASEQLSGSLRFSCMAECSYVRVWNGATWSWEASDNHAWVAWDILTQPVVDNNFNIVRYDGIDPSRLDLAKFKEWADYCNTLVPNGKGGTEKLMTFNGGFDAETTVWEAALQVCQAGRAMILPTGRNYTVVVNKPSTPVQMFTVGNINLDSFEEIFLPMEDRAADIEIDYVNADDDYKRDKLSVVNPAIETKINKVSLQLIGCTRASEAWRHGMFRLNNNQYILRMAKLEVDTEAIGCTHGDVINVQHDIPQWGYGGRLVAATTNSVTLDREVTIEAGKTYSVMVSYSNPSEVTDGGNNYICKLSHIADANNKPTGVNGATYWQLGGSEGTPWVGDTNYVAGDTTAERTVTNAPGTYTVLNLSSSFSIVPKQYDIYSFGELNKVVKPFRVMDIQPTQELKHTLWLIEYNASIYNSDTAQPVVPTPNYSSLNVLPSVTNIVLDELYIKGQDGALSDVIDVYFTKPNSDFYKKAEIWYNNGSVWMYAGESLTGSHRISNVEINKTYQVAVVTVNTLGHKQQIQNAPKASIDTLGKDAPPSNVTNFTARQNGQYVEFHWDHIPDADLWGYEIRQGTNWESARVIKDGIQENSFTCQAELNGTYRYLIKAIDNSEIYSNTAASADITLVGINENINVILSQDEMTKGSPADGTKTNFVYVNDYHALMLPYTLTDTDVPLLTDQSSDITNYNGSIDCCAEYVTNAIDTQKIGDTFIRVQEVIDCIDTGATDRSYPDRTDQTYPADTDTHVTMPVSYAIYYSVSDDGISYSDWKLFIGTVQEAFRFVKIKFTVNLASQTGRFKLLNFLLSFDVPDVSFTIAGLSIASGTGTDISYSTYNKAFYSTPVVRATLTNDTVAKVPVVSNQTATGCHIDLLNTANSKVSGTVNVEISGY